MEPNYTLDHYDDDFEIRFLPGFHVPIKQLQFSRQEMDDEVVKHCDFLRTKFLDLAWIACMYIRNKLIPKSMLWKDLFIEFLWMRKFDTYETFRQDFRSKVNIRRHKGSEVFRCNLTVTSPCRNNKLFHIGKVYYYSCPKLPGMTRLSLDGMVKTELIPPLTELELSVYKNIKRISLNHNARALIEGLNCDVRDRNDPWFDDTNPCFLKDDENITSGEVFADVMNELFDNKLQRQSLVLSWELIRQFQRLDLVLHKLSLLERPAFIYHLYSINNAFSLFG